MENKFTGDNRKTYKQKIDEIINYFNSIDLLPFIMEGVDLSDIIWKIHKTLDNKHGLNLSYMAEYELGSYIKNRYSNIEVYIARYYDSGYGGDDNTYAFRYINGFTNKCKYKYSTVREEELEEYTDEEIINEYKKRFNKEETNE